MKVEIDYGRGALGVDVPSTNLLAVLRAREMCPVADVEQEVRRAIGHPVSGAPLREIARGKRDACVVIPDKTRPLPNAQVLPAILRTLEEADLPRERILILIATGLHRPNEGSELDELVGERIARDYRCENHVARDRAGHKSLGRTLRGITIEVDRRYLSAQLKLLVGLVEPHFMAGFSGGRKMVCPGIASAGTITGLHSPALLENERATTGMLAGNPVHETSLEVARLAGADFTLNVAIDARRQVVAVFAGGLEPAHETAARFVRDFATARIERRVPVVVTSCGGYPLDDTFYQAVKGIVGAASVLQEGGTIVAAGRLGEGIGGEEYRRLMLGARDWRRLARSVLARGEVLIDQWEFEMHLRALRRGQTLFYTDGMDAATLARCFVTPVGSVEEGIAKALAKHGPGAEIAVIPQGPYVIAECAAGEGGEA
ncbi:MAG: nickel-dependent lactate racemase [Planctomycetota bacterium]